MGAGRFSELSCTEAVGRDAETVQPTLFSLFFFFLAAPFFRLTLRLPPSFQARAEPNCERQSAAEPRQGYSSWRLCVICPLRRSGAPRCTDIPANALSNKAPDSAQREKEEGKSRRIAATRVEIYHIQLCYLESDKRGERERDRQTSDARGNNTIPSRLHLRHSSHPFVVLYDIPVSFWGETKPDQTRPDQTRPDHNRDPFSVHSRGQGRFAELFPSLRVS